MMVAIVFLILIIRMLLSQTMQRMKLLGRRRCCLRWVHPKRRTSLVELCQPQKGLVARVVVTSLSFMRDVLLVDVFVKDGCGSSCPS